MEVSNAIMFMELLYRFLDVFIWFKNTTKSRKPWNEWLLRYSSFYFAKICKELQYDWQNQKIIINANGNCNTKHERIAILEMTLNQLMDGNINVCSGVE